MSWPEAVVQMTWILAVLRLLQTLLTPRQK